MTTFYVELTPYGWAVRDDTERLALYATKRHAIAHAEQRRADLKKKGRPGTLVVPMSDEVSADASTSWRKW
jgi:hypothetical protein